MAVWLWMVYFDRRKTRGGSFGCGAKPCRWDRRRAPRALPDVYGTAYWSSLLSGYTWYSERHTALTLYHWSCGSGGTIGSRWWCWKIDGMWKFVGTGNGRLADLRWPNRRDCGRPGLLAGARDWFGSVQSASVMPTEVVSGLDRLGRRDWCYCCCCWTHQRRVHEQWRGGAPDAAIRRGRRDRGWNTRRGRTPNDDGGAMPHGGGDPPRYSESERGIAAPDMGHEWIDHNPACIFLSFSTPYQATRTINTRAPESPISRALSLVALACPNANLLSINVRIQQRASLVPLFYFIFFFNYLERKIWLWLFC